MAEGFWGELGSLTPTAIYKHVEDKTVWKIEI